MSTEGAIEADHADGTFSGAGGVQLYYQFWRPRAGSPPAVVAFVHGFGAHGGLHRRLVDGLVGGDYAVYTFDLRGMGRSPGPRGYIRDWSEYREDVGAFLRLVAEMEPQRPVFLVGESLGGLIVLEYAERRPGGLRGVIALSPLLSQPGIHPLLFTLARILSRVWPRFSLNTGLDFDASSRDGTAVQSLRDDPLVHSRGTARLGTEVPAAIERVQAGASDFSAPLLMLLGTADTIVPPDGGRTFFRAVAYADKELREYEGGYHMLSHDLCADEVVQDIATWLDRHLTPPQKPDSL
jgi:alpha-beta hydrolase superfamily lysophospholipase